GNESRCNWGFSGFPFILFGETVTQPVGRIQRRKWRCLGVWVAVEQRAPATGRHRTSLAAAVDAESRRTVRCPEAKSGHIYVWADIEHDVAPNGPDCTSSFWCVCGLSQYTRRRHFLSTLKLSNYIISV